MAASLRPARLAALGLVLIASCRIERAASGRPGGGVASADSLAAADVLAALRQYYARTTARQWQLLQQCFWPRASITTVERRSGSGAEEVQTGTIEEVIKRAPRMKTCPVNPSDEIARASVQTYGPLADAWVTYRWRCGVAPDSEMTHYGIDAFHLIRHHGEWRIASLTYTKEVSGQPLEHQP
jgi:hypothetical protein